MLDALTLDQMRILAAIADTGSFRMAAQRLSRVQSAISHAIANLEAELGVVLFDRSGHRPVLTPEGKALLVNARDILLRVDAMRARARGLGHGVELELSVTVDTLFPMRQIGAALAELRQTYPSVALRVAVEPMGGPPAALIEDRSLIAVMVGEDFRHPRITLEAITAVMQVAVVAADHPLALRAAEEPIALADLADHLQIVLSDPSRLSEGREFNVLSPRTCRVNTQDAKYDLIAAGLGWGRLPAWLIAEDIAAGRLVRLATRSLGRNAQYPQEVYLAHRLDRPLGPAAQAFCNNLKAVIAREAMG